MAKIFDKDRFNSILVMNSQNLRAVRIDGKIIELSNELILDQIKDVRMCKKRVMHGNDLWKTNFDMLYSLDPTVRQNTLDMIRTELSRKGGVSCQKIHGKNIRRNLNNGVPWNKDLKGRYPFRNTVSEETKKKISIANSGSKNGMYGKIMSSEDRQKKSEQMIAKIRSGQFTPNSNNRNTHWDSTLDGTRFRSSWEALYQYYDPNAEYEVLRIPYRFDGQEHIYIVDFINHQSKIAIEVKPRELMSSAKTISKIRSLKEWCEKNSYNMLLVDQQWLISQDKPSDLSRFDNNTRKKIEKLYEIG